MNVVRPTCHVKNCFCRTHVKTDSRVQKIIVSIFRDRVCKASAPWLSLVINQLGYNVTGMRRYSLMDHSLPVLYNFSSLKGVIDIFQLLHKIDRNFHSYFFVFPSQLSCSTKSSLFLFPLTHLFCFPML